MSDATYPYGTAAERDYMQTSASKGGWIRPWELPSATWKNVLTDLFPSQWYQSKRMAKNFLSSLLMGIAKADEGQLYTPESTADEVMMAAGGGTRLQTLLGAKYLRQHPSANSADRKKDGRQGYMLSMNVDDSEAIAKDLSTALVKWLRDESTKPAPDRVWSYDFRRLSRKLLNKLTESGSDVPSAKTVETVKKTWLSDPYVRYLSDRATTTTATGANPLSSTEEIKGCDGKTVIKECARNAPVLLVGAPRQTDFCEPSGTEHGRMANARFPHSTPNDWSKENLITVFVPSQELLNSKAARTQRALGIELSAEEQSLPGPRASQTDATGRSALAHDQTGVSICEPLKSSEGELTKPGSPGEQSTGSDSTP